ncbi:hypothetical protein PM082_022883 [Marasmius tenuissimus]|nr:hypothetical protein PM082_022883 [Marasmius tenuissimus]
MNTDPRHVWGTDLDELLYAAGDYSGWDGDHERGFWARYPYERQKTPIVAIYPRPGRKALVQLDHNLLERHLGLPFSTQHALLAAVEVLTHAGLNFCGLHLQVQVLQRNDEQIMGPVVTQDGVVCVSD